uniref:Uncharacterized protein n=1 Tax=Panagrolaimus sp. JU765 TaxID=591449 RepID=A0AC34RLS2_9BILA
MFSTYTVDSSGNARRKVALRRRKQNDFDDEFFDSKSFFQKVILDRFINRPLIVGTENASMQKTNSHV